MPARLEVLFGSVSRGPEGLCGLLEGLIRQLVTVAQSTLYPRHVRCSVMFGSAGAGLH